MECGHILASVLGIGGDMSLLLEHEQSDIFHTDELETKFIQPDLEYVRGIGCGIIKTPRASPSLSNPWVCSTNSSVQDREFDREKCLSKPLTRWTDFWKSASHAFAPVLVVLQMLLALFFEP